jgi:hypothetical protein
MSAPTTEPRRRGDASRLRILVGGYLGLLPAGGITWDYIQYPVGFAALGHDVFYVEDTRLWPVYQTDSADGSNCAANVAHLAAAMDAFGLGARWGYRDEASGRWFGLGEREARDVCRTADVLVNVSCATYLRDEYARIPARALVDSDPMFTQIQYVSQAMFTPGSPGIRAAVEGHTHHFTFGEHVGAADCRMPTCGFAWRPTRQPVCLSHWVPTPPPPVGAGFTTLMNWTAAPPLVYDGTTWGQKDIEFRRFLDLPRRVPTLSLSVAVGQTGGAGARFPVADALANGWRVLDPTVAAPDWRAYRAFIRDSLGEFSVAKETYVKGHTGWFSCRSACYLAAGRPVVTQDTGWSRHLPSGEGLLAFDDGESAVAALATVAAEPGKHARAARAVAAEYFDSRRVLGDMLAQLGG